MFTESKLLSARPLDWPAGLHTGPAIEQGSVPRYLIDLPPPAHQLSLPPLRVIRPDGRRRVETCDVVVIGSGAGGAVVAKELAEEGLDVVVIEEGDLYTKEEFVGSPMERFMRLCRDGAATAAIGNVFVPLPLGRTVGGTTTLNSGTCFRVPNKVLDQWERSLGLEINRDQLERDFRRVEELLGVRPVPWELLGPNGWIAHQGARALGLTGGPILRNVDGCHGTGQCVFGCPTDAKQSMHLSYLPRAMVNGARIYARTRADWIVLENGRARGVEASQFGPNGELMGSVTVRARAVVAACGAVGTPLLLLKNRIGNASGHVGRNLSIHPATGVAGWFPRPLHAWRGTLQQYYIDSLFDSHDVMIEATNSVPAVAASALPGFGLRAKEKIAGLANIATVGLLVSDTSRGRVRRGPRGEPLITYRLNRKDVSNLFEGLSLSARILLAAGAERVMTGLPGLEWVSDERDLTELRRRRWHPSVLKLSAYHPMGTTRMGRDPSGSVVNEKLESHEVPDLFITDGGVFPSCLGVNPQVTIMTFATGAARHIAERLSQ